MRSYGPDTPRQRHDHAHRQSSDTTIEGSARRANGAVRLNRKTVARWRKRAFVHDAAVDPKAPRSTVLTGEEGMIVAFSKHAPLPLDDCLYTLQATMPHLTRSALQRCFQSCGISRLP